MSRHIVEGATAPAITGTIIDADGPVLLGASVVTIQCVRDDVVVKSYVATVVYVGVDPDHADAGKWTYTPTAQDTDTPGVYRVVAKVVNGASVQYFPEDPALRDTLTVVEAGA